MLDYIYNEESKVYIIPFGAQGYVVFHLNDGNQLKTKNDIVMALETSPDYIGDLEFCEDISDAKLIYREMCEDLKHREDD